MTRIVLAMLIALTVTNCTEVLNLSKQFIHKLSIKVINQIESQMKKERNISFELEDGCYSLNFWKGRVKSLDLEPTTEEIIHQDPSVIGGIIQGSVSVSGNWNLKTTVFGNAFSISGETLTYVSGLKIINQVAVTENTGESVKLKSDRNLCSASVDVEDLRVDISRDEAKSNNWLFQMFKKVAKEKYNYHFNKELTRMVCDVATDVIGKITKQVFEVMFEREFSFPVKSGGKLNVDFTPTRLHNTPACLLVGSWEEVMEMLGSGEPESIPDYAKDFANQVGKWCTINDQISNDIPGSDISMLLGQDEFADVIKGLHQLNLLELNFENKGNVENRLHFQMTQNGSVMKTIELVLPGDMAWHFSSYFEKSITISSIGLPEVTINEDGISVKVKVKARFKLFYKNGKITYDEEYHAVTEWKGKLKLQRKNDRYSLVPEISVQTAQWEPQWRKYRESQTLLLNSIERLLDMILTEKLATLMEEEMESGLPVNIPGEFFRIGSARVSYIRNYVILSAEDIIIHL
ncbi:hypothetical protein ACHWQZ_G013718 [Mnemiopsis leidyi]